MEYIKFELLQKLIQSGEEFCVDNDIEDIELDSEMLRSVMDKNKKYYYPFEKLDIDSFFCFVEDELESDYMIRDFYKILIENDIMTKKTIAENFLVYYGEEKIEELYLLLENESSIYESDIKKLSNTDFNLYFSLLNEDTESTDLGIYLNKRNDFLGWCVDQMLVHSNQLEKDDFNTFIFDYDFGYDRNEAKKILMNYEFIQAYKDNIHKYDQREDLINLMHFFDNDKELVEYYLDWFDCIKPEDFMNEEEKEEKSRMDKEYSDKYLERCINSNRISAKDATRYILENDFGDTKISVQEGHLGLEDMIFSALYINGKLAEETEIFNNRPWISGRSFGDYQLSTDFFLNAVNKYKLNK